MRAVTILYFLLCLISCMISKVEDRTARWWALTSMYFDVFLGLWSKLILNQFLEAPGLGVDFLLSKDLAIKLPMYTANVRRAHKS